MSAVVLVEKGISCKFDWTERNTEDKFTKNLTFFSSSAFVSFPHVNTHGRRVGAGFHWAPLRRVMRDEIRGSLLHMANSAHARGSTTDASTCRFNTLTSVRLRFASVWTEHCWCWWNLAGREAVEAGITSESLKSVQWSNSFKRLIHPFVQFPLIFRVIVIKLNCLIELRRRKHLKKWFSSAMFSQKIWIF